MRFRTRDLKNKHQKGCRQLGEMNETTEINESEFIDYNNYDNSESHFSDANNDDDPREYKYDVDGKFGTFDEKNGDNLNDLNWNGAQSLVIPLNPNEITNFTDCDNNITDVTWKCKKCSSSFKSRNLLRLHNRNQHLEPKEEFYSQENIKQERLDLDDLQLKTENDRTECDTKVNGTQETPNLRWKCKTCSQLFETRERLRKHRRAHTGVRKLPPTVRTGWRCNICDMILASRDKVRFHKQMLHPNERKERIRKSNDESKNWGDVGEYECELCNKIFISKSKIRKHMDVHKNKDRPKRLCTICGLELCSTYNLNNHIRTVHGRERKFQCQLCDRRFSHR